MTLSSVDFVAFALVTLCFFLLRLNKRARLPLPPGPPRWPVVGSMFSMPKSNETLDVFNNWGKEYGDVTHARVLDKDFIVLNSREATVELLERRSIMYSSRPRMVMANELVGWGGVVSTMSYGEYFKRSRKLLYEGMSPKAMETLRGPQEQEAIRFARRLLDTPEDLLQHIRQTSGATVIKLTYGYHIEDRYDHLLSLVEKVEETFSIVTTPGLFLVDVFPWLKYVPWAPFKFKAKEWGKLLTDLREQPAEYTREQMKKGTSEPCLMGRWFERMEDSGTVDDEKIIKWAGTAIVAAGTDTTVSAISFFFAALVHYPEVQAAAQAEIDRIVGTNRLPTYSDRGSLKYVEALYKEVLRWNPVTPFGLPHRMDSDKDDVYRGMRIPRGSIVIANIWAMARDPSVYRDPESFMPERFLQSHHELDTAVEMDPENFVFGFGRRRCPGIHVAQSSVWLSIALTLAVYDVTAAVGSDGKPELPNLNHPQTALNHPEPFKCTIKPRSSRAKKLIQDSVATMSN